MLNWCVLIPLQVSLIKFVLSQASLNGIREELEGLREASQTHRKRFLDMILVLLRDVGDVGSIIGGQMNEQKVCFTHEYQLVSEISSSETND